MTASQGASSPGSRSISTLDHGEAVLAFALEERAHINVWRNKVEAMGLSIGPWLRAFKQATLRGAPDDTLIGGTVSVIDTFTNTVAATIPVGVGPIGSGRLQPGWEARLRGEWGLRRCFCNPHGKAKGGGDGRGGDKPIWGRHYAVNHDAALKVLIKPMVRRDVPWLRRRGTEV